VVALAVAVAGCSATASDGTDAAPTAPVASGTSTVAATVAVALAADELAGLLWMREEEQLARPVR
jgi:hypothetical protein